MKHIRLLLIVMLAIVGFDSLNASIFSPGRKNQQEEVSAEAVVKKFYSAFQKNDAEALSQTLAKKYSVNNMAEVHQSAAIQFGAGNRNLLERMKSYHEAFPNLSIKINQFVSTDKQVVAEVSMTGIQKGNFFGIAPTNRYITIHAVAIFTIENGEIQRIDEMLSEYNLMRQLGFIAI